MGGLGFIERSGASVVDSTDDFFSSVGRETRRAIKALLPEQPTREQAQLLIGGVDRKGYLDGVDLDQYSRTLLQPLREMVLRGGKAWRSYGILACIDAVGGDSQPYAHWLALPELLHVGSLTIDDVQGHSGVRPGGTALHTRPANALAINVGCASYFRPGPDRDVDARQREACGDLRGNSTPSAPRTRGRHSTSTGSGI